MRTVFVRGWAIAGLTPSLGRTRRVKDLAGQMVKLAMWYEWAIRFSGEVRAAGKM